MASPIGWFTFQILLLLESAIRCFISGYRTFKEKGVLKLRYLDKINEKYCSHHHNSPIQKSNKAHELIQQSIKNEIKLARRMILIGICSLCTGIISFIGYTSGRIPALNRILIYTIIIIEMNLLLFLYFAFGSARESFTMATKMKSFVKKYKDPKNEPSEGDDSWLTLETFTFLQDTNFSWPSYRLPVFQIANDVVIGERALMKDIELMEDKVNSMQGQNGAAIMNNEREDRLLKQAEVSNLEGCAGCICFLVILIPFYCFLVEILKYYHNKEKDDLMWYLFLWASAMSRFISSSLG